MGTSLKEILTESFIHKFQDSFAYATELSLKAGLDGKAVEDNPK